MATQTATREKLFGNLMEVRARGASVIAVAEESWSKLGGMDDRAEVHGSGGVAYADLLHGNAIETYSTAGYDYAVEKADPVAFRAERPPASASLIWDTRLSAFF